MHKKIPLTIVYDLITLRVYLSFFDISPSMGYQYRNEPLAICNMSCTASFFSLDVLRRKTLNKAINGLTGLLRFGLKRWVTAN